MKKVWNTKEVVLNRDSPVEEEGAICEYLEDLSIKSCNLYNAALAVELNSFTASRKKITGEELTPEEQEVKGNIAKVGIHPSPSGFVYFFQLCKYMTKTKNPDYYAMPSNAANCTIKQLIDDYQDSLNKRIQPDDSMQKDGNWVTFSKQGTRIKFNKETGRYFLKLPKTKLTVDLGEEPIEGELVKVEAFTCKDAAFVKLILLSEAEDDEEE